MKVSEAMGKIYAFFFFCLVVFLKLPVIRLPFHWDDLATMSTAIAIYKHWPNAIWMQDLGKDIGHPPFFYGFLAFIWSLFGFSIWASHLVVIIFSFIGVYFTYLLGAQLKDRRAGLLGALLLFFSPLYFAQSGTLNLDLPLTSLLVMAFYFLLKGRNKLYFFAAGCAVLTKVSGLLLIPSAMIFAMLEKNSGQVRSFLKKILVHLCVFSIFMAWAVYHKHKTGWLIYPQNLVRPFTASGFIEALYDIMSTLFFADSRFLLTISIIYAVFLKGASRAVYWAVFIGVIYFAASPQFFNTNVMYLLLVIYIVIYAAVGARMVTEKNGRLPLFLFIFLGLISLSIYKTVCYVLPRYFLFIYPFYFILAACCLADVFKNNNYYLAGFVSILILLSIGNWYGHRSGIGGSLLESNMEYIDQIRTHQSACKYIMDNYPQSTVLTNWPQILELREPLLGYVKRPVRNLNFLKCGPESMQEADLVYYSSETNKAGQMKKLMEKFNLVLLRDYRVNGKRASVYKLIK